MRPSGQGLRAATLGVAASLFVFFASLALSIPTPAGAATHSVNPVGTGDYATIQAALQAAVDGDVVELADGTYTGAGNRDVDYLNKAVTVRSAGGDPAACIIDCEGNAGDPHRGFLFVAGEGSGSVLAGVTVRNGWSTYPEPGGGAILCDGGSSPRVESCVFRENSTCAIRCETGSAPTFVSCLFERNSGTAGAAIQTSGSTLTIDECAFVENESDYGAAAIFAFNTDAVLTGCTFLRNGGGLAGGAVEFAEVCQVTLLDCTFADNTGSWSALRLFLGCDTRIERCTFTGNVGWAAVYSGKISKLVVQNSTFWGNQSGAGAIACGNHTSILRNTLVADDGLGLGVWCPYDFVALSCCNIYGNAQGDWVGRIADQYGTNGNISEAPLLCDPGHGDFMLNESSPCAPFSPPNPGCDLIGAWPVGCGTTMITPATWGAIKARFRE